MRESRLSDWRLTIDDWGTKGEGAQLTPEQLKARTKRFALEVIALVGTLPRTLVGEIIARQIVRSGTSTGANYRAACRARSRAEFVAKLGVAEEEADETLYWLELLLEARLGESSATQRLIAEAAELVAILSASRKTARIASRKGRTVDD
jgi:four helix bundle protein